VFVPRHRSIDEINAVLDLIARGLTHREVSRRTGVPIMTIRGWLYRGLPRRAVILREPASFCNGCGREPHDYAALPHRAYTYLLGMYLGDGHIAPNTGSYVLRLTLDLAYPEIVEEAAQAMNVIRGRRPVIARDRTKRCLRIASYWKSWPCLIPQHGPGRKHRRKIKLSDWQAEMVKANPRPFLRGLIHTDGWRGLNRVHVKGKEYSYVRYQFSNRSDDIKRLFTDACDAIGVDWRPWGPFHISVARRESVAKLERFIGPKR
jgi:hypothetical protein